MMRLKMSKQKLTFKEGCEMYIQDCKSRNLREGGQSIITEAAIRKCMIIFRLTCHLMNLPLTHLTVMLYI